MLVLHKFLERIRTERSELSLKTRDSAGSVSVRV